MTGMTQWDMKICFIDHTAFVGWKTQPEGGRGRLLFVKVVMIWCQLGNSIIVFNVFKKKGGQTFLNVLE